MPTYRLRRATLDDAAILARHRNDMFIDMGVELNAAVLAREFTAWLQHTMPAVEYHARLIEAGAGEIVAGGGMTIIPWPPGPRYPGGKLAFVYNVYTEPAHRGRGLARRIMAAIHAFCVESGISSAALNASRVGLPLYESIGYRVTESPMMFIGNLKV
jgi:GNAT superfamily N-acetyltransferase